MNIPQKLIESIRDHSPYLAWASEGRTPAEIKLEILKILEPHFKNPSVLSEFPIGVLAHEAVTIKAIHQDPWAASMFDGVLSEYRDAMAQDPVASLEALAAWDELIVRAMSEFMSIYFMEVDKSFLAMDELCLEAFRNIGGLLEGCLQPQLKALLHHVRILHRQNPRASELIELSFGSSIEELSQKLRTPDITAPPPWGIRLNHWRNIAQHHSANAEGDHIVCKYRSGKVEHRITLTRSELINLARQIQSVLGIVRSARSVFIADNVDSLRDSRAFTPRPEILLFETAVGIATQGFSIVDIDTTHEIAHLHVRDETDQDAIRRGVHASQFLVATWTHYKKPVVQVTYSDKKGRKRLEATVAGSDCKEIAEELVPFEILADRATFRIIDPTY